MRLFIPALFFPSIVASQQRRDGTLTSPMEELDNAILGARQSLTLHNDKTSHLEAVLQSSLNLVEESTAFQTTISKQDELLKKAENIVRQLNMRQLLNLSKNLTELLNAETTRRRVDNSVAGMVDSISKEFFDDIFDAEKILAATDAQIEEWVSKLMSEEISNLSNLEIAVISGNSCVSVEQGAREVQQAIVDFMHDKIGLKDHAIGSAVVYEFTSPSYQPPVSEDELLGSWKWRRFIPEDWEYFLPQGWQNWNVRIPSSLSRILGLVPPNSVASPQTIFHPDTRPGSCWPLSGERGFVTFRLPYPVQVSAISLDHVSRLLLKDAQDLNSAPKDVSVFGFPPCDESNCDGLGFDIEKATLLSRISYNIEGPSTQTFSLLGEDNTQSTTLNMKGGSSLDSGSCSAATSACGSTQLSKSTSAIQIHVESNWGNPEYTCIYRFRVHGEATK